MNADENGIFIEDHIANMICLKMQGVLDREQRQKLKDVVCRTLYSYKIEKKTSEVSTKSDQNEMYIQLFKMEKENENCSKQTIRQYVNATRHFFSVVNKSFREVSYMDATLYFKYLEVQRNQSAATRNNTRRYIRCFFNWLVENGNISVNPMAKIKPIKHAEKRKVILTGTEVVKLRDSCKTTFDIALVDFLCSTGVRVSELTSLNRSDFHLDTGEVTVFANKTQTWRTVYLNSSARKHLADYFKSRTDNCEAAFVAKGSKRATNNTIQKHLQRITADGGVNKHVTVHLFRKTLASRLFQSNMDLAKIALILGHASTSTTVRYYISFDKNDIKSEFLKAYAG